MPEHDDDGSSPAASTSELDHGGSSPDAFMSENYDRAQSPAATDSAYGLIDDGFSSPDVVSDFDRGGSSPAASNSELNDIDLLSSAPSPIPSEPVSRFSTPPSSAHVASPRTPPPDAQNVGSRQGKNPSKSTPVKDTCDGKERTAARVEDLQNSYKRSLERNCTETPLQEFLLFLLAMALPHEKPESELQPIWDSILSVAVDLCNEGSPVPVPANSKTKKSKAKKSKASESKLRALLHSYRDTNGPETTMYAPWVQLSNHILETLREPRYADRLTDVGLPKLKDIDESTLIFQRNDNKPIKAKHTGLEGRPIHGHTLRCPDVTALSIAAAEGTTDPLSRDSGGDWQTKWKRHSLNTAPKIPYTAPAWSHILLNVEFKKEKDYTMTDIRTRYDRDAKAVDIKPRMLRRSGTGKTRSGASKTRSGASKTRSGASSIRSGARSARSGASNAPSSAGDTRSDVDWIVCDVDGLEFEEEDEGGDEILITQDKSASNRASQSSSQSSSQTQSKYQTKSNSNSKKRSRGRADSSARVSGKKQKSNKGNAVPPGSANRNSQSHPPPPSSSKAKPPPSVQMAMYAAERLSSSVAVRHSIDFLVVDDRLWLWWFDRGGAIQTHGLNFIANLPHFVALLAVLQRFTPENWGQDTMFGSGSDPTVKLRGPPKTPGGPRPEIEISVAVDKPQLALNLFSRASCVVPVKCTADFSDYGVTNSEYVAKIYFPDEDRSNEAKNLAEAYKIAAGENGGDVRGHLPILLAEQTWQDHSADLMEKILHVPRRALKKRKRYRVLRILLFTKLHPISGLGEVRFIKALRSSFLCHGALWMAGLHHRDISEGNLMYTIIDGEISGVVNDFDLAIIYVEGQDRKTESERTGTRIFMAAKLVENLMNNKRIPHIYDFDAESFAYVTVWVISRYDVESDEQSDEQSDDEQSDKQSDDQSDDEQSDDQSKLPLSDWISPGNSRGALITLRKDALFKPQPTSSHSPFYNVFVSFCHAVYEHLQKADFAESTARYAPSSYKPKEPDVLFNEYRKSIDDPLEKLGHLPEVNEAQQRIKDISSVKHYKELERWGLVDWEKDIILT